MADLILEWLNLAVRWFHVVAAIAWIGASFYFIWLDLSLRQPPQWKADRGIKGDLWAIHGGGIYEIGKYQLRPETMPEKLHWFKWEAYSTWISGSCLLFLLYYLQAKTYLLGADSWLQSPAMAIAASLLFFACGQAIYELLLRTALSKKGWVFAATLVFLLGVASWLAHQLFSARAAFLHVGALMATWMAGNVLWGIMPAQRKFVAAVSENRAPDISAMQFAKVRSTHNNYLTLPVVFCMISNHYPFVYGHPYSWLALLAIGALLAWARHFFNLKHLGSYRPGILLSSFIGLLAVAVIMAATDNIRSLPSEPVTLAQDVAVELQQQTQQIISVHCASCHSQQPAQIGFTAPPANLIINSLEQLQTVKVRALVAVKSGYMPLGNLNHMSEQERIALITWLEAQ